MGGPTATETRNERRAEAEQLLTAAARLWWEAGPPEAPTSGDLVGWEVAIETIRFEWLVATGTALREQFRGLTAEHGRPAGEPA